MTENDLRLPFGVAAERSSREGMAAPFVDPHAPARPAMASDTPSAMSRTTVPLLALTLALAAACSSTGSGRESSDVNELVRSGEYARAVQVAAKRCERYPDDAKAREEWRLASVALLLEEGRRLSFERKDEEALAKFEQAHAIAPDVEQVVDWREASLTKLADKWVARAVEYHANDELPKASESYEMALTYRPDDSRAKNGLGRVLIQLNYRRGMGEKYFQTGLEAMQEYFLDQAVHHFSATGKYDDDNERAKRRRAQADTLRAEERVLQATELEDAGQFAAARNEYRLALLFDADHKLAKEGFERAQREEKAAEFLRECENRILRRQFTEATKALDEGAALTQRQTEAFDTERARLKDARLMVDYEAARAVEVDHRYEDAIGLYTALIDASGQGYFQDALARRDTLVDLVSKAESAYARAQTTSDAAQKLQLLEQVLLVYPEFRDAASQADALRAQLAKP